MWQGAMAQGIASGASAHLGYIQGEQNRAQAARFMKKKYQYAVADMRKAGLNPMLAVSGGFGAGGSPNQSIGNTDLSGVGNAISTAMQLKKLKADTELVKEMQKTESTKQIHNVSQSNATDAYSAIPKLIESLINGSKSNEKMFDLGQFLDQAGSNVSNNAQTYKDNIDQRIQEWKEDRLGERNKKALEDKHRKQKKEKNRKRKPSDKDKKLPEFKSL